MTVRQFFVGVFSLVFLMSLIPLMGYLAAMYVRLVVEITQAGWEAIA